MITKKPKRSELMSKDLQDAGLRRRQQQPKPCRKDVETQKHTDRTRQGQTWSSWDTVFLGVERVIR